MESPKFRVSSHDLSDILGERLHHLVVRTPFRSEHTHDERLWLKTFRDINPKAHGFGLESFSQFEVLAAATTYEEVAGAKEAAIKRGIPEGRLMIVTRNRNQFARFTITNDPYPVTLTWVRIDAAGGDLPER